MAGDHDLPSIVLIHGSMDRQAAFSRMARLLSPAFQVVTYDRRGYGKSTEQRGPFSVDRQIADLGDVLDYTEASGPVILVGHSFGGVVSLAFAQRYPERVRGLVVYESPMSWEPWWPKSSGGSAAVAVSHDPEAAAETFLRRFIGDRRWDELPEATKHQRRSEGEALVGELSDIRTNKPWDLELVRSPLIAGYGTRSKPHLRSSAEILGNRADCRVVELEGAHHNAHSGQPQDFVTRLIEPLARRLDQGIWS